MKTWRMISWVVAVQVALALPASFGQTATENKPAAGDGAVSGYSAASLFNQGNSFAKEGKNGLAILSYERARLLAPQDEDIQYNLHFLRKKAGLPEVSTPWYGELCNLVSPNTAAWLGCLGLMIVLAGVGWARWRGLSPFHLTALGLLGGALMIISLSSAAANWPVLNSAVVIAANAPARISPSTFAETSFQLRDGEMVSIESTHGEFVLVESQEGHAGWVSHQQVQKLVP